MWDQRAGKKCVQMVLWSGLLHRLKSGVAGLTSMHTYEEDPECVACCYVEIKDYATCTHTYCVHGGLYYCCKLHGVSK